MNTVSWAQSRQQMVTHPTESEEASQNQYLQRAKLAHIVKAARSATAANILAPLLCIPVFSDEVSSPYFAIWLGYMLVVVTLRTWIIFGLAHQADNVTNPQRDLRKVALVIGIVGFGWGLGWPLMTPDLSLVNRMIYVYMTTAAMISSMFAYSVDSRTFFTFTLTIMLPAASTLLWANDIFPWPFSVGLAAVYIVVLGIARSFSRIFEESVGLRFRNERLYQELAAERDQSIAANVAKSKFIAAASHDLRQPLHAINLMLELVQFQHLQPQDSQLLQKIKNSITALNSMFEALLNMSKLDSHTTRVEQTDFALGELAAAVREIVQSRAQRKGLLLNIDAPAWTVRGDRLLLQQILINLVMNAIQYTEQGRVEIHFRAEEGRLALEVSDTGIGISPEDQKHIFHEFFRAHRTRDLHEGLGLGLTIVKRVCDLMGASITLVSRLGEGSTFTIVTHCTVFAGTENAAQGAADELQEPAQSTGLRGQCIAVIEDDDIITDAYKQTLSALGARVIVLSERDDVLQQQLQSVDRIDCILSDYRLKHTTGDLIIEKLRENFNRDIPAVMVTADTSPGNIGVFDGIRATVLFKPLTFKAIVRAIENALASARP
jgi:signal transduction histidine kinase